MSEIQVNGYVRVPKGTMVYPTGDGVEAPSTRDQVVKVARIFDVDVKSDGFYLLLPDEMRLRYFDASGSKRPAPVRRTTTTPGAGRQTTGRSPGMITGVGERAAPRRTAVDKGRLSHH